MVRSLTDIITSLVGYISSVMPGISTRTGTVTKDVIIDAPAQEFETVYTEIDSANNLTSLENYNDFTEDELDAVASDYGLSRLEGTNATGTAIFRFKILTDVDIPYGTKLNTSAGTNNVNVNFIVSQAINITQANLPTYYNYSTSFYEVPVSIESENIGAVNNVAAGTIINILSNITNLDSVTNYLSTSGGTDNETNQALSARIQAKRLGNNVGTKSGYQSTIDADNRVTDSAIVSPNDPEMLRNEYGGSIDIYILGQDLTGIIETQTWSTGTLELIMQHQPVYSIGSIVGATAGTLVETTDYIFTRDVSLYTKSSASTDKIVFTTTGLSKLTNGEVITINYSYNKVIEDLQTTINADGEHILTADVLIREATEVLVNITANVTALSGYTKASVQTDIQTALGDFIDAFTLNQDLHPSDIIAIIEGVNGVDKVDLATLIPATDVIADRTQYLRSGTFTINML